MKQKIKQYKQFPNTREEMRVVVLREWDQMPVSYINFLLKVCRREYNLAKFTKAWQQNSNYTNILYL